MQKHKDCAAHHQSDLLDARYQLLTMQFDQAQTRLANGFMQTAYSGAIDSNSPLLGLIPVALHSVKSGNVRMLQRLN